MSKDRYYYDRITMALDDLLQCKRYCEAMLKLPLGKSFSEERTIYESLYVAFIVSYGRVFTTSNPIAKEFKEPVSHEFGNFRSSMLKTQVDNLRKFHERIIDKRNTAVAHSDGNSRNYQHYGDTALPTGRNPYFPYKHEEVEMALLLVNNLISLVGEEQSKVGGREFSKPLFGESGDAT
ncbi:hypothetical protein [Marinomonas aquiplantarum]|uniref:HEPN AbiU2-like domain-containing protein n=1 Tax=Marinomonas aquiplantarum TaxID=491951 RepID=A0A366CTC1_9GAMM|nr:hypothetical protein [Marinomonas aquiplantarum]RBO79554.1 hypothetical protein DFP76_1136 [Marinomonas aquiplantarum]